MSNGSDVRLDDLAEKLKSMLNEAPRRGKGPMFHLFGIMYATELGDMVKSDLDYIAHRAGSPGYTMGTEILKGIKLAQYVDVKAEFRHPK
jgi:hypothetical protein